MREIKLTVVLSLWSAVALQVHKRTFLSFGPALKNCAILVLKENAGRNIIPKHFLIPLCGWIKWIFLRGACGRKANHYSVCLSWKVVGFFSQIDFNTNAKHSWGCINALSILEHVCCCIFALHSKHIKLIVFRCGDHTHPIWDDWRTWVCGMWGKINWIFGRSAARGCSREIRSHGWKRWAAPECSVRRFLEDEFWYHFGATGEPWRRS